ncbi:hypothetical protein YB2330_005977 [Saitoella coloradoensis]
MSLPTSTILEITTTIHRQLTTYTLPPGYTLVSGSPTWTSTPAGYTIHPVSTGLAIPVQEGYNDPQNFFHYMPNYGLAVAALVLYAGVVLAGCWQMVRHRAWYFAPLVAGGIMESIGYGARIPLARDPAGSATLFKCMDACVIIAPIFYAAAEYVFLGRLMNYVGRQHSLLPPTLISYIFVASDVVSLCIQIAGAVILLSVDQGSSTLAQINAAYEKGNNVLMAGLAVNLASFAIFCLQITYFDIHTRRHPSSPRKSWRPFLYVLYTSCFFVLVRQIYRVIEFSQGWTGYLPTHEAYFYGFDTLMILLAGVVYVGWGFPGRWVPTGKGVVGGEGLGGETEGVESETVVVDESLEAEKVKR